MPLLQTIVHPTDFDVPSKEAFRVSRSLAQAVGARVVAFHVVAPPAIVTQDGRVIVGARGGEPVDVWAEYRTLQQDTPKVPVQYVVVVGDRADAKDLLENQLHELGEGVVIVMGSHGRTGMSRFLWGSKAEVVIRDFSCPVLVVKAPSPQAPSLAPETECPAGQEVGP